MRTNGRSADCRFSLNGPARYRSQQRRCWGTNVCDILMMIDGKGAAAVCAAALRNERVKRRTCMQLAPHAANSRRVVAATRTIDLIITK